METVVLRAFIQASRLRQWIARPDRPPAVNALKILFDKAYTSTPSDTNETSSSDNSVTPVDLQRLTGCIRLQLQARVRISRTIYTRASTHLGNSLIQYYAGGNANRRVAGSIIYIYRRDSKIRLAVQRQLPAPATITDPFRAYPELHAFLCSSKLQDELEEVETGWVLGHSARWQMSATLCVSLLLSRVCMHCCISRFLR